MRSIKGVKVIVMMVFLMNVCGSLFGQTNIVVPFGNVPHPANIRSRFPLSCVNGFERTAMIYSPSELGLRTGAINKISFYLDTVIGFYNAQIPYNVYLLPWNDSSFSTGITTASIIGILNPQVTAVLDTALFAQGNWIDISFPNPYIYTGGNLMIVIETNLGATGISNTTSPTQFRTHFTNVSKSMSWNSDNIPPTSNGTLHNVRANTKFEFRGLNGNDLGIMSMISPAKPVVTGMPQTITIQIGNNGNTTITSGSISYQLDSNPIVRENLNTVYQTGQTALFSFTSNLTIPSNSSGILRVWIDSINGAPDVLKANDTLTFRFCSPLNGVYTIGGIAANYPTFSSAIDALICGGVSGPVTFNVNSGIYNEGSIVIPSIAGTSNLSNISFVGVNSSSVIVTYDTSKTKMGFDLVGADYFKFADLTFQRPPTFLGAGATHQFSIRIRLDADNNIISNCVFLADSISGTTSIFNRLLQINSSSFNSIYGCIFRNGNNQLDVSGAAYAFGLSSGNRIFNNNFERVNNASFVTIANQKDFDFYNNNFNTIIGSLNAFAVTVNKINNTRIYNNKIYGDLGSGGFNITDFDGSVSLPNLFFNNVVSGNVRSSTPRLLSIQGAVSATSFPPNPTDYIEIVNNTLNISMISTTASTIYGLINIAGGTSTILAYSGLIIKNNILNISGSATVSNIGSGARALNFSTDTVLSITQSNNNIFSLNNALNSNIVRVNNLDFSSINDWKAYKGLDSNSLNINPGFLSFILPIPTNSIINNLGQSFNYISTDILGNIRNAINPDPGAYEFNVSPTDLGVFQLISPQTSCGLGNDTLKVAIINSGTVAVHNFTISYQVNGGTIRNSVINDTINSGDTIIYSLNQPFNFSTPGAYYLKIVVQVVGDNQNINDTLNSFIYSLSTVTTFPYIQNFESGNGGWISGGSSNSWEIGTPSKPVINTAGPNGTQSYVTSLIGNYNANERSYVTSPCFNFSTLRLPRIKLSIFWSSQFSTDGATLQGSVDGGLTWFLLGSVNELKSRNWYNNNTMVGGTGSGTVNNFLSNGNQIAWSGTFLNSSQGWVEAERSLPELANQSNVRLRIAFASDALVQNDGFAFDNIEIWQPLNPVITSVDDLNDTCVLMPRKVKASILQFSPIQSVNILYSLTGLSSGPFSTVSMNYDSIANFWIGTIPAGSPNITVYYKVVVASISGLSDTSFMYHYTDDKIIANAGLDQTIAVGQTTNLIASYNAPKIKFTEITLSSNGIGSTPTYPAYTTNLDADFVEISNLGNSNFDISGYVYEQLGVSPRTFTFPAGTIVPANAQVVLHLGTGNDSPINLYFNTGGLNGALSSSSAVGFILRNPDQSIIDVVSTNSFNIVGVSGVSSQDWIGAIPPLSNQAGVIRKNSDSNSASDWIISSLVNMQTIGSSNIGITNNGLGSWSISWSTNPPQSSDTILVGPFSFVGVYPYVLTVSDGFCTKNDTINVTVSNSILIKDVGFSRVSTPSGIVNIGTNQVVSGWLRNYGTAPLSNISVGYNLNNGVPVIQTVPGPLIAGDSIQVTFITPYSVPSGPIHFLKLFSRVIGDIVTANDSAFSLISVNGIDVGLGRIVSPVSNSIVSGTTSVTIIVQNLGFLPIANFDIAYSINNSPIAIQTVGSTIQPGDSLNFTFTMPWTPTSGGSHILKAYVNGFLADGNKKNDTVAVNVNSIVSTSSINLKSIEVYPNPSHDVLNIDFKGVVNVSDVYLVDPMGRIILHEVLQDWSPTKHVIPIAHLNNGQYFIWIIGDESKKIVPIIVQK